MCLKLRIDIKMAKPEYIGKSGSPASAPGVSRGSLVFKSLVVASVALTTTAMAAIFTDFDGAIRVRLGVDGGELHIEGGQSE